MQVLGNAGHVLESQGHGAELGAAVGAVHRCKRLCPAMEFGHIAIKWILGYTCKVSVAISCVSQVCSMWLYEENDSYFYRES